MVVRGHQQKTWVMGTRDVIGSLTWFRGKRSGKASWKKQVSPRTNGAVDIVQGKGKREHFKYRVLFMEGKPAHVHAVRPKARNAWRAI